MPETLPILPGGAEEKTGTTMRKAAGKVELLKAMVILEAEAVLASELETMI